MESNILNKIKTDLKKSMIGRNEERKNFLRVILGELDRKDKNPSNKEIILVLKKLKSNAELMKNQFEINVLNEYLPQEMNNCDMKDIIENIIAENNFSGLTNMGKVMKILKQSNFANLINFKKASVIVKEELTENLHS